MAIIHKINTFIWGVPVLALILFSGILLTGKSRFAQIRLFPAAVCGFFNNMRIRNTSKGQISGYRALCTALAATVGTGNIAGVAGAIAIGGPGVIFWMWVSGLMGMIIKFAEVVLALHYRRKDATDHYLGGPMHMIANGMPGKMKFLSLLYCLFGLAASFGVGNGTQINAVVDGVKSISDTFGFPLGLPQLLVLGMILSCIVTCAFRKGTEGLGCWAEKLVPFASICYIMLAAAVLAIRFQKIPGALYSIFAGACNPRAMTGGVIGSAFLTLRVGISRGIFTNEAGMGTASIAHASANVENPIEQGFLGMVEVFFDTIVLCSLTALVILCSGVPVSYGSDPGIILTLNAFSEVLGDWVRIVLTFLVCIFAFATVIGWGFYGIHFSKYLFGNKSWHIFAACEAAVSFLSVLGNTAVIWTLSEIFNGLMAIPNLIALIWLMPVFFSDVKEYKKAHR